jgi:hypothetical protein
MCIRKSRTTSHLIKLHHVYDLYQSPAKTRALTYTQTSMTRLTSKTSGVCLISKTSRISPEFYARSSDRNEHGSMALGGVLKLSLGICDRLSLRKKPVVLRPNHQPRFLTPDP